MNKREKIIKENMGTRRIDEPLFERSIGVASSLLKEDEVEKVYGSTDTFLLVDDGHGYYDPAEEVFFGFTKS